MKYRPGYTDRSASGSPTSVFIGKQVFRQEGAQVEKGENVESDLFGLFNEHFNSRLMVQDHLGFPYAFALCDPTEFDAIPGIEAVDRLVNHKRIDA